MRGLLALALAVGAVGCAAPRAAARSERLPEVTESRVRNEPRLAPPAPAARPVGPSAGPGHAEPEQLARRHVVRQGETVYRISRTYGLTPAELMRINGLRDPRELKVGQALLVPGAEPSPLSRAFAQATAARAQDGAPTLEAREAAARPGAPAPRLASQGRLETRPDARPSARPATLRPSTRGTLRWPLRAVLYGRYGKKGREPHDGIDLAAPEGTPVRTAGEGRVLYAGEQRGYGNIVIVEHSDRLVTLYAHNRDLRVKTGQRVLDGQVLATVGESGRTSGPHLHFEVRVDGRPVDPLDYLGERPAS